MENLHGRIQGHERGDPPPRQVLDEQQQEDQFITRWNMFMKISKDVLKVGGVAVGLYAAIKIVNSEQKFDRFCTTVEHVVRSPAVITALFRGSIKIQLLTTGNVSKEALLEAYFSKKILIEYQKIFESINEGEFVVDDLVLTQIGVFLTSQQVFDDIRKMAMNAQYAFSRHGVKYGDELVFSHHPILQDESKIRIQSVSAEDDKDAVLKIINDLEMNIQEKIKSSVRFLPEVSDQPYHPKKKCSIYDASKFYTSWNDEDCVLVGEFRTIRKCFHQELGNVVANCFKMARLEGNVDNALEQFQQDVSVRCLLHKNIVQSYGTTQWADCVAHIMEYMEGGCLDDLLSFRGICDVPWLLRHRFFVNIADGLSFLHHHHAERTFVHGNLNPKNIFLTRDLKLKITVATPSSGFFKHRYMSAFHTAPEVLKDVSIKGKPSLDVYSFAVIGFEILTMRKVFEDVIINVKLLLQLIVDRGQKPDVSLLRHVESSLEGKPQDLNIFKLLESTVMECWNFQPKNRPNMHAVCKQLREITMVDEEIPTIEIGNLKQLISKRISERKSSAHKVSLTEFKFPFEVAETPIVSEPFPHSELERCPVPVYNSSDFLTGENGGDVMARGGFAVVLRCKHNKDGLVAIKGFDVAGKGAKKSKEIVDGLIYEATILSQLDHRNIVKIFGITSWSSVGAIVLELGMNRDLQTILLSKRIKVIPWRLRFRFLYEISAALFYLHYHDEKITYIHGDLKPQNIVLTSDFTVKLIDFGSTALVGTEKHTLKQEQLTLHYAAPELLVNPKRQRTKEMDIYSLSLIAYEIMTRRVVFTATDVLPGIFLELRKRKEGVEPEKKYLEEVSQVLLSHHEDSHIFTVVKDVFKECWNQDPEKRPDIQQVCGWLNTEFDKVDKAKLERQIRQLQQGMDLIEQKSKTEKMVPLNTLKTPLRLFVSSTDSPSRENLFEAHDTLYYTAPSATDAASTSITAPPVSRIDFAQEKVHLKILVVGDKDVGKSSIATRICDGSFDAKVTPFSVLQVKVKTVDKSKSPVSVLVWTLAESDALSSILSTLPVFDGVIFVYDITNAKSFFNIPRWLRLIEERFQVDMVKMLLGNKCDLEDERMIKEEESEELAEFHEMMFSEVSAKENIKIDLSFYNLVAKTVTRTTHDASNVTTGLPAEIQGRKSDKPKKYEKERFPSSTFKPCNFLHSPD